ncbi:helix-turn-helix transcriptional regulator [Sinorhizobium medicae]|uniref:helix-turn-helix transcriptional regulator n=1 Tax=Sinorhizobium medicae TaxID=110321 RepID=UPI00067F42F1|nr:LuxR family transcriptional regulator [Sinorhizobium medicae]
MATQSEAEHAVGMFLDQIRGETSVDQMFKQLSDLAQIFNCGWIAYGAPAHAQNMERMSRIKLPKLTTYPKEWQEHCEKCGYDMLEPSVRPGPFQWSPLLWADVYKVPNTTERRIFVEAREFGLRIGVTIPLPWPWGISPTMSFASTRTSCLNDFAISRLHIVAIAFHIKVVETLDVNADVPSLTARQKECISWVAQGKSSWDIGFILGITPDTVDYHIKIVMKKLGTVNRMVAAKKAEQLGLINP